MSSNQPAIVVRGVSKSYTIRRNAAKHTTLADALVDRIKHPFRRAEKEVFWALQDLNFEVAAGEIVGIIGRNGAGKSTLLKILSRITRPTTGEVELHGRVGSLLEVGTGFHQELTGRENIYLSGTILGMKRREIKGQFDAIIDFAGIEQFLDTPVKRYSSGMYVRLAFAVAAHLNPEILLVDEVLAVGDANFQKKCLGKMEELGSQGRTVIFVSHSMPTIHRLCNRVALLDNGHLVADGSPSDVTRRYLHSDSHSQAERMWHDRTTSPGDSVARLKAVRVCNTEGKPADTIDIRKSFSIEVEYWNLQSKIHPTVSLWFVNTEGVCLFVTNDFNNLGWWKQPREVGIVRSVCHVPGNFLAEGQVFILAAIASYNPDIVHALERDIVSFLIVDRSEGDGVRGEYAGHWPGVMRPLLKWSSKQTR